MHKGDQLQLNLRRSIQGYFFPGLWIIFCLIFFAFTQSDLLRIIWIINGCVALASISGLLARRYYFQVKGDKLFINDAFRTRSVELDQIERVIIEPGPFGTSQIVLKNQRKLSYIDRNTDYDELRFFFSQFDIPFE